MKNDFKLVSIRDLKSKQSLKEFDCGVDVLNEFLFRYASKNDSIGIGKTFLALDEDDSVAGYFTLASAQVRYEEMPEQHKMKLPKYPIPALRIVRLASRKDLQGKGTGRWLLSKAFIKAVQVADVTGLYLIIVDAKEFSKGFYEHYGFQRLEDEDLSYFMLVDTVRKAMQNP